MLFMNFVRHNHSWLFALFVTVVFLCARAGSVAHAANYGTAPHNHDSNICVFSVLANEEEEDGEQDGDQENLALPPILVQRAHRFISRPEHSKTAHIRAQTHPVYTTARSPPA